MNRRIVGIAGAFGSGKDTAAEVLLTLGAHRFAFGDPLKREVAALDVYGWGDRARVALRYAWACLRYGWPGTPWDKPTSPAMRHILQWWGTDFRRAQDPDYWVAQLDTLTRGQTFVVIPDVRFYNELRWIKSQGGSVICVRRPRNEVAEIYSGPERRHVSETLHLDDSLFDAIITNDASVEELHRKVKEWAASS